MKNTPLKKLQFVAFLAIASFVGIQESQGYKIHCPAGNELNFTKDEQYWDANESGVTAWIPSGNATSEKGGSIKLGSHYTMRVFTIGEQPPTLTFHNTEVKPGRGFWCNYNYQRPHVGQESFPLDGELPRGETREKWTNSEDCQARENYIECQDKN